MVYGLVLLVRFVELYLFLPSCLPNASLQEKGIQKREKKKKSKSKSSKRAKKRKEYADNVEESEASSDDYSEEEQQIKKKKKKSTKATNNDPESDVCDVCADGGFLIVCERCDRNYHLNCLSEPLNDVPEGVWICPTCVCYPPSSSSHLLLLAPLSPCSFVFLVTLFFRLKNKKAQLTRSYAGGQGMEKQRASS